MSQTHIPLRAATAVAAALFLLTLTACAGSGGQRLKGADAFFEEGMQALEKGDCLKATEQFQRLVSNFPGSRLTPEAQYYLAEAYYCSKDYVNAVFEYQRLLDTYPSSQWLDEAQFKIGESYYRQLRRAELDQKETYEALNYYRDFMEDNPDSPLAETARERIADCRGRLAKKEYLNGRLYQKRGYPDAAAMTYEQVLRGYPDTIWYYHALLRMGELALGRSEADQARANWEEVVRDSGSEPLAKEAGELLLELPDASQE